jgi:rare lipoprotein A
MGNNGLESWFRSRAGSVVALGAVAVMAAGFSQSCRADDAPGQSLRNTPETRAAEKARHHERDLSAKKRMGTASFYAKQFAGRKMADGAPMDPAGDNAASKTLPLGTTAKVTNLETGKSAVVTIQDRGPYVPGRIVDLSPATARQIGISERKGVALVVVAPITVPQPDGKVKLGAAAHEAIREAATEATDRRTVQR